MKGRKGSGRVGKRVRTVVVFALTLAWIATPVRGQEDPPMPELPQRFSIAVGGTSWVWNDAPAGTASVGDATSVGLELESLVRSWLAFRLGGGFGRPNLRIDSDDVGANQYHVEVMGVFRVPWPLAEWNVTPFIDGGWGSLVHDPRRDGLATKNQSMWLYGAGMEWDALHRLGVRVAWRRTEAELSSIFDPLEQDSVTVDANRWLWSLYWRF